MEVVIAVGFFALCMAGMGIGAILQGRFLRGSCGGPEVVTSDGDPLSCGACPKKERELCPSDNPLLSVAQMAHPDPAKHR